MIKEFLIGLVVSILAVFAPVVPLLVTVGFLIILDFIVGVYRAWKMNEIINSRKMGNTISKMLLYQITILSLWVFEIYILGGILPVTKIGAGMIAVTELKSIDESVERLTGIGVWKKLVKVIKRGESETKDFIS
jgi:hypothetical protein